MNLSECPKCREARYIEDTPSYNRIFKHKSRKKTARKVYRYFPLTNRLRQLFNHRIYSRLMRFSETHHQSDPRKDVIEDIHHAPVWDDFKRQLPITGEPNAVCDRRVAFMMTADAASMSSFNAADFSITPLILSCLNWPIHIRNKPQRLLYTGITPVDNKQTTIYLQPLVQELTKLRYTGIRVYDRSVNAFVNVRCSLILITADYRAVPDFMCNCQSPAYCGACHRCFIEGKKRKKNVTAILANNCISTGSIL